MFIPLKSNTFLFFVFPTTAELSYEPIESESRFYGLGQKWENENWSEEAESNESWEEEVDNLVAWTNALDVKSLNYDD